MTTGEDAANASRILSTYLRTAAGRTWQAECERLQAVAEGLAEELRVTRGELDLVTEERDTALLEIDRLLATLS